MPEKAVKSNAVATWPKSILKDLGHSGDTISNTKCRTAKSELGERTFCF